MDIKKGVIEGHNVELVTNVGDSTTADKMWPILVKYYDEFRSLPSIGESIGYDDDRYLRVVVRKYGIDENNRIRTRIILGS